MTDSSKVIKFEKRTCATREETIETIKSLSTSSYRTSNSSGKGPLILSDVPSCVRNGSTPVVLGIDEAGRGSVLGPMVYGAAYWSAEDDCVMSQKGFDDSKALTPAAREAIFEQMVKTLGLGLVLRVLHASEISRNMLRAGDPYNLNAMSHDAAIEMIWAVLDLGVSIERVFIDTVGSPESYRAKLERVFEGQGIQFKVEKKADANYSSCAAASIAAKVCRDNITSHWNWSEERFEPAKDNRHGKEFGSGYPSDPKCKDWLDRNLTDPVFCFPDLVRFSWEPTKVAITKRGAKVEWEADDLEDTCGEESDSRQQTSMADFFVAGAEREGGRKRPRLAFFDQLGLSVVKEIASSYSCN